ncbi:DUF6531 domain-containing protein [uncultured Shewanella sp.]|uniref:DUF6531 domain-containing protein n=1 Tax=uncultured Shewanella sp. TaxID=173975 RepID=UPI00260FAF1A|nr:DUF6531 domain-containing protein [uncultured Shewanella sp.]
MDAQDQIEGLNLWCIGGVMLNKIKNNNDRFVSRFFNRFFYPFFDYFVGIVVINVTAYLIRSVQFAKGALLTKSASLAKGFSLAKGSLLAKDSLFAKGFSVQSLSRQISMPVKRQGGDTASKGATWPVNGLKAYMPSLPDPFQLSSSLFNRRVLDNTSAAKDNANNDAFHFKNSRFNTHLLNVGRGASQRTCLVENFGEGAFEQQGHFTREDFLSPCFDSRYCVFPFESFMGRYSSHYDGLQHEAFWPMEGMLTGQPSNLHTSVLNQNHQQHQQHQQHQYQHSYHDALRGLRGFNSMDRLFDFMGKVLLEPKLKREPELESGPESGSEEERERESETDMSAALLTNIQNQFQNQIQDQLQNRSHSMFAGTSLEDFTQRQALQINANASENVDNVTGRMQACQLEFSLAGFIPLTFKRAYSSAWHQNSATEANISGLLGRTWWCSWDLCLVIESGQLCFIDERKQQARFAFPLEGQEVRSASLPAWWLKRFQGRYYMRHVSGLTYGFHESGFHEGGGHDSGFHERAFHDTGLHESVFHEMGGHESDFHMTSSHENGANRLLLSEIIDENKNSIHFIYEKGLLTWVLLSDDRYIKVVTEQACITQLVLTDSKKHTIAPLVDFTYNSAQQLAASHAHGRHSTYYDYDTSDHLLKTASGIEAIEAKTDSPVPSDLSWVQYRYDDKGRAVSRIGAQGLGRAQWRYDDDNGIIYHKTSHKGIVCYHLNAQKQLVKWINAKGGITSFEWRGEQLRRQIDPLGQCTAWEYDDWGQVCAIKQHGNRVHRYGFNHQGKLVSATDSEGKTWQYLYDKKGNRIEASLPCGDKFFYQYTGRGQLAWIVKQDGSQMGFQYHTDGQLKAVYLPERIEKISAQEELSNQNALRDAPRLEASDKGQYQKIKDTLLLEYDALGRLISQQWQTEAALMKTRFERVQLDRKALSLFDFNGFSVASSLMQNPIIKCKKHAWSYDDLSMRPAKWTTSIDERPLKHQTFHYNSRGHLIRLSVFNADQAARSQKAFPCRIYRFTYGAFGCLRHYESTKTPNDEKSEKRENPEKVQLGYDAHGQLMGMKSGMSHWCYRFNASGERSELVYGDGRRVKYEYDALGRLSLRTGLDGTQLRFFYDALGRLIQKQALSGVAKESHFVKKDKHEKAGVDRASVESAVVMSNTFFHYNAQSQLLSVSSDDVRGRKMRVDYRLDVKGKVIGESIHDGIGESTPKGTPEGISKGMSEGMSPAANEEVAEAVTEAGREEYLSVAFFQQAGCEHKALIGYFAALRQRHLVSNAMVNQKALCVFEREPIHLQQSLLQNMESLWMNRSPLPLSNEAISNEALCYESRNHKAKRNERTLQDEYGGGLINKGYANSVQHFGNVIYRFDVCGRMIEKRVHDAKLSAKQTRFIWNEEDKLMAVLLPTGDSWRCYYDGLGRLIHLKYANSHKLH